MDNEQYECAHPLQAVCFNPRLRTRYPKGDDVDPFEDEPGTVETRHSRTWPSYRAEIFKARFRDRPMRQLLDLLIPSETPSYTVVLGWLIQLPARISTT